ncbi:BTB/POZ domain-containing protein KCTD5-like protein [Aphelenchoides avenae]|nr:BTB/POZ domain-containing protein KCTD5-like protein [Aphelenchus avenae]
MRADNNAVNWIRLNVFHTTKHTLRKYKGSSLATLCDVEGIQPSEKDESGAFLIDRDPEHFRLILNFLRNGSLDTDANLPYDGLMKESEFYGLTELAALIDDARKEEVRPKTTESITMVINRTPQLVHVYFLSGNHDVDEGHFLPVLLMELEPWRNRRVSPLFERFFRLSVSSREVPSLCGKVATILRDSGFKLDRASDDAWVFVKRV